MAQLNRAATTFRFDYNVQYVHIWRNSYYEIAAWSILK